MTVLVDTPVWSLALRRRQGDLNVREQGLTRALEELVREGRAQIMGAIRQELLSGIREEEHFHKLRDYLGLSKNLALRFSTMKKRHTCTTDAAPGESQDRPLIS